MRPLIAAVVLSVSSACIGPAALAAELQPLDITVTSQSWWVRAFGGFDQTVNSVPSASVNWTMTGDPIGSGNATVTSDGTMIAFSYSGSFSEGTNPQTWVEVEVVGSHAVDLSVPDFGLPRTTLLLQTERVSGTLTADCKSTQDVFFSGYVGSVTGEVIEGSVGAGVEASTLPLGSSTHKRSAFVEVVPGETISLELGSQHYWFANSTDASYTASYTFKVFALAPGDTDGDSTADIFDNCVNVANADQLDNDSDGIGNLCECGDISGDGFVNTIDARLIQRCAVGEDLPEICENPLCDATGEGDCNTIDARLVQRLAVGDLAKQDLQCAARS